jgi:hypothetical protein
MPIYHILWETDSAFVPSRPQERVQLWITQTQWVLADLKAGIITSWGRFSGETCGYAVTGDLTPQELDAALLKYTPVTKFTNRTVISAEESMTVTTQVAEALQQ